MVVLTASAVALPAVLPPSPLSPSRALAASFPPCGPANDGQYWQDPDTDIEYQCVYNPATGVWEWVPKYMPGLAFARAPEFEPIVHAETGGETAGSRPAKYTIKTPRLESGSTTLTVSWGDGTSTPPSGRWFREGNLHPQRPVQFPRHGRPSKLQYWHSRRECGDAD